MIKTVISDGTEQCVTGLGGSNTVIVNFGSSELYASAYPDIVPDGRNVAAISAGSAVNLRGTCGRCICSVREEFSLRARITKR